MTYQNPTATEILDRDEAAAHRANAQFDLRARKQDGSYHPSWATESSHDIPVWHMRPGMVIRFNHRVGPEGARVVSAPQYDAKTRTEHVLVEDVATGERSVFSTPYKSFIYTTGPAWMFSDEHFHLTFSALSFA